MNKVKFAYLIIAHSDFDILERLIGMLDDSRNDIYIHIDKKITSFDFNYYKNLANKSQLIFLTNRVNIKWGNISQLQVELSLLKEAYNNNFYSYYHLLSGVDLPIKSQDYIHDFFSSNLGSEFIGFFNKNKNYEKKVHHIHLFRNNLKTRTKFQHRVQKIFSLLQDILNYKYYNDPNITLKKGPNWFSISHDLVTELLKEEQTIMARYKYSSCADEIFLQTFIYNSIFKDKIYNYDDEYQGCMRLIDWERGDPYIWTMEDLSEIVASEKLFARKFGSDKELVDKIVSLYGWK